ncbi:MAG: hypothetical protein PUC52_06985 [bacterium]|nr:hypothetical protein [bacterium]
MKIKRILLSVLALALVVALSVGATLAFLSAEDTRVINNFSFGSISVQIAEEVPTDLPDDVEAVAAGKGVSYTKVTPGVQLPKQPAVSVKTDVKAYVFINVSGFNANLKCDGINSTWTAVDGTTDTYGNGTYYKVVEANNAMTFVDNAFESVTVSSTCTGSETLPTVYIDVFAIQFDNISFADACAAAAASFAAEAAPAPTPAG